MPYNGVGSRGKVALVSSHAFDFAHYSLTQLIHASLSLSPPSLYEYIYYLCEYIYSLYKWNVTKTNSCVHLNVIG